MQGRDGPGLSGDARALLVVQALRAVAYGLGSVTIGLTLEREGLSGAEVGLVLAAILAGSALASLLLARYAERVGRRRAYRLLLLVMGIAGTVFALTAWPPALVLAALTGTLSTDANDSGPMTVLETAMLPHTAPEGGAVRLFGLYNTVAVLAGALGALAAGLPGGQRLLFAYAAAAALGLAAAATLSARVEAAAYTSTARAVVRPIAPLVAGPLLQSTLAAPFLIAGGLKIVYDLALYALFRDRDRT